MSTANFQAITEYARRIQRVYEHARRAHQLDSRSEPSQQNQSPVDLRQPYISETGH
jgi:hypothetical protein